MDWHTELFKKREQVTMVMHLKINAISILQECYYQMKIFNSINQTRPSLYLVAYTSLQINQQHLFAVCLSYSKLTQLHYKSVASHSLTFWIYIRADLTYIVSHEQVEFISKMSQRLLLFTKRVTFVPVSVSTRC